MLLVFNAVNTFVERPRNGLSPGGRAEGATQLGDEIEQSLVKELTNLQTVFDVVSVGLLLIDEKGGVRRVNDVASKWAGKDITPFIGAQPGNILGCMHALDDPAGCGHAEECRLCSIRSAFECALRSNQPVRRVETQATLSVSGKSVALWLEISADPVLLDGARHALVAMSDITARKEAERNLLKLNDDLRAINDELIRSNQTMVDRELRMIELKKEVNELLRQMNQPPRYRLDFEQ